MVEKNDWEVSGFDYLPEKPEIGLVNGYEFFLDLDLEETLTKKKSQEEKVNRTWDIPGGSDYEPSLRYTLYEGDNKTCVRVTTLQDKKPKDSRLEYYTYEQIKFLLSQDLKFTYGVAKDPTTDLAESKTMTCLVDTNLRQSAFVYSIYNKEPHLVGNEERYYDIYYGE